MLIFAHMKYLLITPPFVQLNTPYPATSQLKAYLKEQGHDVFQADIGIELAERIFCREFVKDTMKRAEERERLNAKSRKVFAQSSAYVSTIDAVWRFLRGKDDTLANRIATRDFLPEGHLFSQLDDDDLDWAYGTTGITDRAKHFATLYIEDLADFIADIHNCEFSVVRYKAQIAEIAPTFDPIYSELNSTPNTFERMALDLLDEKLSAEQPQIVGFSLPFPGTLIMALRMAQHLRTKYPNITIVAGGGYVNTELRQITDPRMFEFIDYLCFDDGELPLASIAEHIEGSLPIEKIISTKYCRDGIVLDSDNWDNALNFNSLPAPDFSDLHLDKYISMVEITNPMHRLWSDGKWNKMTVAHGCYHAKCSFCDTKLDYIGRFSQPKAEKVVDSMETIMKQTRLSGFHFTDEALPPKLLKDIARIIIERKLVVSFWGNVRFEKNFDTETCLLLAQAGCIAVSGGLEVASPRILQLINKGVTIPQAIAACAAFNNAGIMVHTYLMYGFPTQTTKEAVESLEIVRQMFECGIVQSAFWHRYSMTIHSPTGTNPEHYSAEIITPELNPFANNAVDFSDGMDEDWTMIGNAMKIATQNFMYAKGFDMPIHRWFRGNVPHIKIAKHYVKNLI